MKVKLLRRVRKKSSITFVDNINRRSCFTLIHFTAKKKINWCFIAQYGDRLEYLKQRSEAVDWIVSQAVNQYKSIVKNKAETRTRIL